MQHQFEAGRNDFSSTSGTCRTFSQPTQQLLIANAGVILHCAEDMQMLASNTLSLPFHATVKTTSTFDSLTQRILNAHDKIPGVGLVK